MRCAKPGVISSAVSLLLLVVSACSGAMHGPARASSRPDADAARAPADAGSADSGPYTIYAASECPLRRFPSGLEVKPTKACSGRTGECWVQVCRNEADCTDRAFGRCYGFMYDAGAIEYTNCAYDGCRTNADCPAGTICACAFEGLLQCVRADCLIDANCPAGEQCVRADFCGQPLGPFLCTSPADECRTNDDCVRARTGDSCSVLPDGGHFACTRAVCGE
jgi:hypothetical protein